MPTLRSAALLSLLYGAGGYAQIGEFFEDLSAHGRAARADVGTFWREKRDWFGGQVTQNANWIDSKVKQQAERLGDQVNQHATWIDSKVKQQAERLGDQVNQHATWIGSKVHEQANWIDRKVSKWVCNEAELEQAKKDLTECRRESSKTLAVLQAVTDEKQALAKAVQAERDTREVCDSLETSVAAAGPLSFGWAGWACACLGAITVLIVIQCSRQSVLLARRFGHVGAACVGGEGRQASVLGEAREQEREGEAESAVGWEQTGGGVGGSECRISDTVCGEGEVRLIKIECPGLCKHDVVVDLICNGCAVTVSAQAPDSGKTASWTKKFQFALSEGIFDYVEDQAVLDQDALQLAFRARPFQKLSLHFQQDSGTASAAHQDAATEVGAQIQTALVEAAVDGSLGDKLLVEEGAELWRKLQAEQRATQEVLEDDASDAASVQGGLEWEVLGRTDQGETYAADGPACGRARQGEA